MTRSPLALLPLLFMAAVAGCGDGTSKADKARMGTLDSIETDINNSILALEQKTDELERSMNELDTTTAYR